MEKIGWAGPGLMHRLDPEMYYFVCVRVSVAAIIGKLAGMEKILNGAEPDSAMSA